MHLTIEGTDDGEPIMLLHGAMVAGWMWQQQVQDLSEYRCLVPDLPGFDHSGGQSWSGLADVSDQVATLIEEHVPEGRAHVVGLSLGGLVALHLAVRHPQVVRSVLVSGVPAGRLTPAQRAGNRLLGWLYGRPWGAGLVARSLGLPDAESRRVFVAAARRSDPRALVRIAAEISDGALPDLRTLQVPLPAVVGGRDHALAQRFVADLPVLAPTGVAVRVADVGHQWNAQRPHLFAALVRSWVSGQPLPAGVQAVSPAG